MQDPDLVRITGTFDKSAASHFQRELCKAAKLPDVGWLCRIAGNQIFHCGSPISNESRRWDTPLKHQQSINLSDKQLLSSPLL